MQKNKIKKTKTKTKKKRGGDIVRVIKMIL